MAAFRIFIGIYSIIVLAALLAAVNRNNVDSGSLLLIDRLLVDNEVSANFTAIGKYSCIYQAENPRIFMMIIGDDCKTSENSYRLFLFKNSSKFVIEIIIGSMFGLCLIHVMYWLNAEI